MINDLDVVQWAYLLDPTVQLVNTAGKPLTDGYIEVYIAGSRNKYYCASDFDGTLHPFQIPLDSLGSNIILANPENAYDVYVYNRFGSLVMSRYNVTPADGGAVISNTERINDLEELVVSAVTGLQGQIDDINEALDGKKDKQEEYSVTFTPTQTVSAIMQNEDGEIEVIYQEIDLPEEVPNVNIVSPASTINITSQIDEETNTKTFSIDLSDLGHLEYGQYMATEDVFTGANMYRIKGNLNTTLDGKIQLHHGNSYHITVRGYYTCLDLSNTADTLNYIEYSSHTPMPVNVDNTVADPQYFEISYDIFKLSADTDYYIAFASSAGKVSNLTVEVHSLSNVTVLDQAATLQEGWGIIIDSSVISVDPSIIPESQVQSDWTEDDIDDPAYIKHKPLEYDLVAGNNISIDVQGSAVVISSTTSSEFATDAEVYNATVTAIEVATGLIPDSEEVQFEELDITQFAMASAVPSDKVYIFRDTAFNRTDIRAAIDAHKVIMDWDSTSNEHRFFTKYEEVTIDGNLCEVYHFAHVETDYTTPFATDWRLGDMAYIYDTVREIDWAEHDTKLFNHEVPDPTSSDDGKVLTASWDSNQASGSWSWQPVTGFATEAEIYDATVTAIETVSAMIPNAQVQSDWTENDSSDPSYIQNKPNELNLVAGQGINIGLSDNDIIISAAVTGFATEAEVYNATVTAIETATGFIPDSEEVQFEDIDITQFAQASAIPTVELNGNDQVTAINGYTLAGGGGGTTYTAGQYISIDQTDTISVTGLDNSNIFWAEYNVTQINEIDAAYKAGKHILCVRSPIILTLGSISVSNGDLTSAEFYVITDLNSTFSSIQYARVYKSNNNTVWTNSNVMSNCQADWNNNNQFNISYIKNKPAIPTVQLNGDDQVTAINNHEIAGTGGATYAAGQYISIDSNDIISVTGLQPGSVLPAFGAGNCIDITSDVISWETTAGITDIVSVSALPVNPVSTVIYLIPEA